MNARALRILEYDKITEMLTAETGCEASAEAARRLRPLEDEHEIRDELRSTTEAVDLIVRKGPLPTAGIYDISMHLSFARKGGCLTMKELLEVKRDMTAAREVITFMKSEDLPELPAIRQMTELLVAVPELEKEIDRCILSEDEMADSASPKLKSVRREIGVTGEQIKNRLNRMASSAENKPYLQDSIVTIRDGRYVIPVKKEHRDRFPGMIHDQSKGGQTLFIEPQAIVDMNNRLRELEVEEQAEIARILQELTDRTVEHHAELKSNQAILTKLDFIMAKGKLSRRMNGAEPHISDDGVLELVAARHPLIDPEKVVPIDITIGGRYRTLIVTGPNTGGKTVSLKTAGLLSAMALSGLHIPASEASRLPLFRDIFADIGDEQSIEQSLSTFSSHMKMIVEITENAGPDTLVLLDELGAGTDPTEGAALAIAILQEMHDSGAMTMATTHYNELKKYALQTDDVENAAMEFDVETLSPTYRLMIGVPGKSNAFEISRKLGLKKEIIDRAELLIERGDMEFENVLASIENDRKRAADDREEARRLLAEAEEREKAAEKKESETAAKREKILSDARAEARGYVRDAKETAKQLQKELNYVSEHSDRGPGKMSERASRKLDDSRRRIKNIEEKYAVRQGSQINSKPVSADDLKIGDRVKLLTLDQNGEVTSLPDQKGDLDVAIGVMKVRANVKDLMLIGEGKERKKPAASPRYGNLYKTKTASVSPTLNVQGESLEDAVMDAEKYLDDVYIAGLEKVTIIHGRGEGILKNGIRSMLRRNKCVASFAPGAYADGGDGVTVVTMKKN